MTDSTATDAASAEPLLSEHPDRDKFEGLAITDRETGAVDHVATFFPSEVSWPGYIESVEAGYAHSLRWKAVRVWATDDEG